MLPRVNKHPHIITQFSWPIGSTEPYETIQSIQTLLTGYANYNLLHAQLTCATWSLGLKIPDFANHMSFTISKYSCWKLWWCPRITWQLTWYNHQIKLMTSYKEITIWVSFLQIRHWQLVYSGFLLSWSHMASYNLSCCFNDYIGHLWPCSQTASVLSKLLCTPLWLSIEYCL